MLFKVPGGPVGQDYDIYVDCFVSCFRIIPHNTDVLKVCLNTHSPPMYQLILVTALHRIITQVPQSGLALGGHVDGVVEVYASGMFVCEVMHRCCLCFLALLVMCRGMLIVSLSDRVLPT